MLAEVGFLVAAACFGIFAYTFDIYVIRPTKIHRHDFSYAYYCLALALLTWGIAVAAGGADVLKTAVLIGDLFIFLGTVFMLHVLSSGSKKLLWLAGAIFLLLLYIRANHYVPAPYIKNGILVFNSQRPVTIALGLIFAFIWLPANLKVAKAVSYKLKGTNLSNLFTAIYFFSALAAIVFVASKNTKTLAVAFTILCLCFIMLIASNVLVMSLVGGKHGSQK